ncbi:hypothetical protein [Pseudactinotalea suaedae]|uniref:hypothetical protein n=1 Tax=Pseudactinotalea suaedae TaxID=1524924 RepID=UPI0012E30D53|nr:hypothetical protein [Pseudactinotalea suaedae]
MSTTPVVASRFTTAELTWLLSLRPGGSATLVAVALGLPSPAETAAPDPSGLEQLIATGRATERRGEVLPHGEAVVVGDVLTSSSALVSVGTATALAGLVAVGRDRVLLLAPAGPAGVEVAALDAATPVGDAMAALAARIGEHAVVLVAVPGGPVTEVFPGADLAGRVQELLP